MCVRVGGLVGGWVQMFCLVAVMSAVVNSRAIEFVVVQPSESLALC